MIFPCHVHARVLHFLPLRLDPTYHSPWKEVFGIIDSFTALKNGELIHKSCPLLTGEKCVTGEQIDGLPNHACTYIRSTLQRLLALGQVVPASMNGLIPTVGYRLHVASTCLVLSDDTRI